MEVFITLLIGCSLITCSYTCTEFILRGKDGSISVGRSMDFDDDIRSGFYIEPAGTDYEGILNQAPVACESKGMSWTSRHKLIIVRPDHEGLGYLSGDGINDVGLTVAVLYLADHTVYQNVTVDTCRKAIPQFQVVSYILGNFENVDNVRQAINSNTFPIVTGNIFFDDIMPWRYSVTDRTGSSIIIEYTTEGIQIYDNIIRAVTNAPTYDWHMTNIKHHVHIDNTRKPERKYYDGESKEHILPAFTHSGLIGLPGDYTSPSRFIRAAAMVHLSLVPETSDEAILSSFHILNTVHVPKGVVDGGTHRSLWQGVKDLTHLCIYYRTYEYPSIRKLCMADVPNEYSHIPIDDRMEKFKDSVEDVSKKAKRVRVEL